MKLHVLEPKRLRMVVVVAAVAAAVVVADADVVAAVFADAPALAPRLLAPDAAGAADVAAAVVDCTGGRTKDEE